MFATNRLIEEAHMTKVRAFLLNKAQLIPAVERLAVYDEDQHLSVVESTRQPIVLASLGITHSKTNAYPGDDDPDPGQDRCY